MSPEAELRRAQERISKLERLARYTIYPEEAEAARSMAAKIRQQHGIFGSPVTEEPVGKKRVWFTRKYVVRDIPEREFQLLLEDLDAVAREISREYFDQENRIQWNADIMEEKFFRIFTKRTVTMRIVFSALDEAVLARMSYLFLSLSGMKKV